VILLQERPFFLFLFFIFYSFIKEEDLLFFLLNELYLKKLFRKKEKEKEKQGIDLGI
jgi:hypothetical protein